MTTTADPLQAQLPSQSQAQLPLPRALAAFAQHFGSAPTLRVRAPGRVNLIGEHTDYSEGFCLPCAIDRETVLVLRPRADARVRLLACDEANGEDAFDVDGPIAAHGAGPGGHWSNFVRGTLAALQERGCTLGGADIAIAGNVPLGAGLSSSAALEVAVGTAFDALFGLGLTAQEIALAGQRAEHTFAGCECGIMDQLASAAGVAGHALLLDCRTLRTVPVPLPPGCALLVVHSGVQRGLVDSEYNLRREQCRQAAAVLGVRVLRDATLAQWQAARLPDALARRSHHVITENQRTLQAAEALQGGDLRSMGRLMRASHESMRDDFGIVPAPLDALVTVIDTVLGPGAEGGARMTGGGFGGCVVALLPEGAVADVERAIGERYRSPQGTPALVWRCRAADGAGLLP